MLKSTATKITLALLTALLLTAGGWIYIRRPERVEIATYVPESALGYLEISSLPQLINQLSSSKAWQQVAPAYGISDKLSNLGKAGEFGWLMGLAGNSEAAVFSQAQIAIAVTGLEVRGEAVKPRFALIALAHGNEKGLKSVIEKRLPEIAVGLFGETTRNAVEQAGLPVTVYRDAVNSERELFSAQINDAWILSNNIDSIRDCLMTISRRQPSMINNFYLQKARPTVGDKPAAFGFVTAEGVKRLMRFGTYIAAGGVVSKAALAGAVGEVFTEFSNRTCDGLVYSSSFENGQFVDRYSVLFKPELTDKLKAIVKADDQEPSVLSLIPQAAREITVYNVVNPSRTIDETEKAISSRVDVAQSFLLHQFILGMREAAFGAKSSELAGSAIGNQIASFNLTKEPQNRVWLIASRDQIMLAKLAENVLTQFQDKRIANIEREDFAGFEILNSSEASRGSAVFIGNFMAVGNREQLVNLIATHRAGQNLKASRQFALTDHPSQPAPILGYSTARDETNEMMVSLARWFGQSVIPANVAALDQLPLIASATSLNEHGVYIETRSPLGNFPFLISLADGSINRVESK